MNYIYDIVLNFNKEYYSFYEWNRKDNIINVKKIPLFLVDNECFNIMKCFNIRGGLSSLLVFLLEFLWIFSMFYPINFNISPV